MLHKLVQMPQLQAVHLRSVHLHLLSDLMDSHPLVEAPGVVKQKFGNRINWVFQELLIFRSSPLHILPAMEGTPLAAGVQFLVLVGERRSVQDEAMLRRVFPAELQYVKSVYDFV